MSLETAAVQKKAIHTYIHEEIKNENQKMVNSMYLHILSSENLKFYAIPIYLFLFGKKLIPKRRRLSHQNTTIFSKDNTKKMLSPLDITQLSILNNFCYLYLHYKSCCSYKK